MNIPNFGSFLLKRIRIRIRIRNPAHGTCFRSIFLRGIHLKGFHGDQIDLRHTHGRRQQQQGQALRADS